MEKAAQQGADAILGLRIDHDEISGQQKGMLMVTAAGTAVRAERTEQSGQEEPDEETGMISARDMKVENKKRKLLQKAEAGHLSFNEDTWEFLIENRVEDLAETIRGTLLEILPKMTRKFFKKRARDYFLTIDEEVAKKHLYNMLHDRERMEVGSAKKRPKRPVVEWALGVLEEGQMLDFRWIKALLDEKSFLARKRALEALVQLDKTYYTEADIQSLREIKERVTSEFEKRGEVLEIEESGMFSSGTKEVWQIKDGVHNEMDREYCKETGLNIYGFGREETKPDKAAAVLQEKIEVLEELL
jgi:flagellar motor protein MotB